VDYGLIFENSVRAIFNAEAAYFALMAIGLNVHFGYTGLLNFGQVAFLAMGAYGLAISISYYGWSLWVGLLVGIGFAVVLALLLGIPTLRLRADYLAIVTIAASEIIRLVARSTRFEWLTGGSSGLKAFANDFYDLNPFPHGRYGIGPVDFDERRFWLLTVAWTLVALSCLMVWLLMRSPWGRVLKAIREDENAVRSLGKNVYTYKMQSLIFGGVIGALGGFVFALANSSVQPDNYGTALTFYAYTALILGGAGTVFGPVVGAMLFWGLLSFIENFLVQARDAGHLSDSFMTITQVFQVRPMLAGLGLMVLMIFRPQGIFGNKRELALERR
jgi:branched-chain amino acid transport system permease protein